MRERRPAVVVLASAVVAAATVTATPAGAVADAPDRKAEPLVAVRTEIVDDQVRDVVFRTPHTNPPTEETTVRILTPPGYDTSLREHPLLLLLHGATDTHSSWTEKYDGWERTLQDWARDKDVVIVMPDGGTVEEPGWYTDWHTGGAYERPEWETFHLGQLLPWVDANLRVRDDRAGRVIAGLSMGGYGTMHYAARYPHEFSGAFSFSGALDIDALAQAMPDIWGTTPADQANIDAHNPATLAANLHRTRLWFRIGQGAPGGPAPNDNDPGALGLEAALWATNEQFRVALQAAGVAHSYLPYEQGGHTWWHWHEGLQDLAWPEIAMLHAGIEPPLRSAPFDHVSGDAGWELDGWSFVVERDGEALTTLTDVTPDTLGAAGTGTLRATTPPAWPPGTTLAGRLGTATAPQTIGADGRATFEIDLEDGIAVDVAVEVATPARPAVTRLAGADRYATAAAVAHRRFPDGSDAVVVVRGDDFADALAAAPLAAALDAPVLLTRRGALPAVSRAELERLDPTRVVVVGGEDVVSPQVATEVGQRGTATVQRLAGADRYATAAAVARALGTRASTAVVASGRSPADALTGAAHAAAIGAPLLLVDENLPPPTRAALAALGVDDTVVVGGPRAVSDTVVAALLAAGRGPRRLAGDSRYATGAVVAEASVVATGSPAEVWLATGADWPDAVSAAAVVADAEAIVVLVDPRGGGALPALPRTPAFAVVLGGTAALPDAAVDDARDGLLVVRP